MTNKIYRAGIIGLGFIGGGDQVSGDALGQKVGDLDGTHFEAHLKNRRVDLVAGSSRDAGRRERFAERLGAKTYADWREMLETEELDILSVATYAPVNVEIVVPAASRVKAIYCEKPISTTLSNAQRMVSACEEAGTLLVINHNRRFNPNDRRLRDLIAAGDLGDLTSINVQWGSGRLGNVGTHMFDLVRMLASREVRAVSGTLDLSGRPDCRGSQFSDPGGWGMLRLDDGLIVTVDAADYGQVPPSVVINGTKGRATTAGDTVELNFFDDREENWPSQIEETSSMDRAVAEIVEWLDDGTTFPYPGIEAIGTLETIIGFHASHAHNAAWTELPLTGNDREIEVHSG